MNLSFYIAKRYAISFSKNKAINIITGIASMGIIASTMALFVFLSVFSGLKEFSLNFANVSDPDLRLETNSGKTFHVSQKQEESLHKSKYIASFSKIIEERVYFMYDNKELVAHIKGVDNQFIKVTDFNKHLYAGEWFENNSENVVIGADVSRKLGLGLFDYNNALEAYVPKPGKGDIENPSEAFNKTLLFPSGIYSINEELDGKFVFCSIGLAQHFLTMKNNEITNLEIKLKPNADENQAREELTLIFGNAIKIKNRAQLNDSLYKMLQSENLFIYLFCTLVVILTLFCLAGAIVMIIIDKRENLKTLYNLGLTQTSIRSIFFTQGILITIFGLTLGLSLAIAIILLQQQFALIMITPSMPYPVLFEWQNIFIVIMTIAILGILSSWIASGTVNKKFFRNFYVFLLKLYEKLKATRKIYFASDQHFGAPTPELSFPREQKFIQWLDVVKQDADAIFLLGDLFDFWFEYKTVVPKGFVRVLGKLAEIKDSGIPIYFFVGNHDLWMQDYFQKELNIPVYHDNQEFTFNGKTFLIGHGDGKGPGDMGYKRMKKVFTNPFSKWLFRWLHPDIGVKLAQYLSVKNKLISGVEDVKYLGEDNEWLVQYCKRKLETKNYNFFVFGHRHLPLEIELKENSKYINLGDWIGYFTYGVFDGEKMELKEFKN